MQYFIHWRLPPGPWQERHLPGGILDLRDAIRSAQARMQESPGIAVRVLDQYNQVHWTNEGDRP
jgi:hypothetical protein